MKHFTLEELTRSTTASLRGIDNTPSAEAIGCLEQLVEHILDPLREAWGKPIHVNSGYRCPRLNKEVGGSPSSQHMKGQAADITTGNPADNRRLYHLLSTQNLPVDQAINERDFSWIHLSYGPRHRRQFFAIR
ncbi:MAG: D-Ala-D-Ala carboxypeptidase family metallohydrolase [Bacteroidales bacterium]|nr:D-Ala-D-Ala carboxypeptidase family metallohydrolase [Bacteroidales bacterium]